jgi:hypothetical protein
MYYLGLLRVRCYDVTKTDGKMSRSYGFHLWSTSNGKYSKRKWTLDVMLGKYLFAIWKAEDWIWGSA